MGQQRTYRKAYFQKEIELLGKDKAKNLWGLQGEFEGLDWHGKKLGRSGALRRRRKEALGLKTKKTSDTNGIGAREV